MVNSSKTSIWPNLAPAFSLSASMGTDYRTTASWFQKGTMPETKTGEANQHKAVLYSGMPVPGRIHRPKWIQKCF